MLMEKLGIVLFFCSSYFFDISLLSFVMKSYKTDKYYGELFLVTDAPIRKIQQNPIIFIYSLANVIINVLPCTGDMPAISWKFFEDIPLSYLTKISFLLYFLYFMLIQ